MLMGTENVSPLMAAIEGRFRALTEERAMLLTALARNDKQMADVAKALGLDPENSGAPTALTASVERPRRGRSREGTLTELVMTLAFKAENGLLRSEITEAILASEFADKYRQNPNVIYNIIGRALLRKEMFEEDRRLYHASRFADRKPSSPLPAAASQPPFSVGGGNA